MSKIIYRLLLYLSIAFLIYYLFRLDYIKIGIIKYNYSYLICSFIFLFSGFFLSTLSWWFALRLHNIRIKKSYALTSHGMAVFAKYIPGKIWVILGRAAKVAQTGHSLKLTSIISLKDGYISISALIPTISLKEPHIYIRLGLIISFIPMLIYYGFGKFILLILITILILSLIIFSRQVHNYAIKILSGLFKKEIDLPLLNFKNAIKLSYIILLYWGIWIIAFYFFLKATLPDPSLALAFAFPISVSYGVLAIVVPAGIGVREGILAGYLIVANVNPDLAVTISVVSRIWFICGEIFIFLLALLTRMAYKKN